MVTMTLDPLAYCRQLMTDLAFAAQVRGDARRTIICHPDEAPGMLAVLDDAALEASQAQLMQRFVKTPISMWGRP
jgi:hypothetical protein